MVFMTQYPLRIDDETWEKFIQGIPRKVDINTYLINLIKKDILKKEEMKNGTA